MDLITQQDQLHKQAQEVLSKLGLMELLKKYGDPQIIGSVALGLMVKRDIDIEVVVKKIQREDLAGIVSGLIKKQLRRIDFAVTDNLDKENPRAPQGMYLGIKYFGDDIPWQERLGKNPKVWQIDMHFVFKKNSQVDLTVEDILNKLTEEKRRIILEIKNALVNNPLYKSQIRSVDVYKAVLDEDVKDLEEFKKYLKKLGKEI